MQRKMKEIHGLKYSQFSEQTLCLSGWLCCVLHNREIQTEWTRGTSGKSHGGHQNYFLLENKLPYLFTYKTHHFLQENMLA